MRLSEKGAYAPAPVLEGAAAQTLSRELAAWSGVVARTHWYINDPSRVDGADFYVGEEELGHLHLDGEAHVAVGANLRDALVKARLAHAFRWSREFVTWPVDSAANAQNAQWLFSLRYDVIRGAAERTVVEKVLSHSNR